MKSQPRFFAPDARETGDAVDLAADEAIHLTRVLRLGVGDEARVFDGRGHEWIARVQAIGKDGARLALVAPSTPREEPRVAVTLAPAVLKGDSLDEVIRDATVLGVVAVQPVVSARTEGARPTHMAGGRVDRWRRLAVAAAKQCGRAVVPAIGEPRPFDALIEADRPAAVGIMCVEPASPAASATIDLREYERRHTSAPEAATILVGPEGGWTDGELAAAADAGWALVTLGRRTFRADAMPLVALALFQFIWRDL